MGIWSRLIGRELHNQDVEQRQFPMQHWVDLVTNPEFMPVPQTTMPSLSEEQVSGTLAQQAKTNGPVFALMLARMQLFAQARFLWTRFDKGVAGDLFWSDDLSILERPWQGGSLPKLLARMEMDVTTAGNSYIRRVKSHRRREDRLVRLNPEWVINVMGSHEDADNPAEAADVELLGHLYLPNGDRGDRAVILMPEEVAHYAPIPDPHAVFTGMSWVTPVIRDVEGDNAAVLHKDRFFRNAATPNLAIKFDPTIKIDQVRKFKEIIDEQHAGAWNAYKTLYLGGGGDPVAIGRDLSQVDFTSVQGKGESRIASAAGVPPSWVGFSEGLDGSAINAGNFTAARRRLSDGTLQHLWMEAAAALESIIDPPRSTNPTTSPPHLWFATKGIPFLSMDASDAAAVQSQESATIIGLVRDGFTPESSIAAVQNHNWSLLEHTGLLSVQVQKPGSGDNGDDDSDPVGGNNDDENDED